MTDVNPARTGMTASEVALLGEREALQRLELLATITAVLDRAFDDYTEGVDAAAEACTEHFADLCVIEIIEPDGHVATAAYRSSRRHGMDLPAVWAPIGQAMAADRRPVLAFRPGTEGTSPAARILDELGARSLMVVPMIASATTLGWFVAASGPHKRGFRPSALRVGSELAGRIALTIHAVNIRKEMHRAAREQSRAVRRLRRLAAAATNLAGAATPHAVLETACIEACAIHEARGAVACWSKADGSTVSASSGNVDPLATARGLEAAASGRISRGVDWVAYPLPNTDPWQHGALVVFVDQELGDDEEPVLSSLASLIPVAFERALGTETTLKHEARLRAVVDSSPVALIEVDATSVVTSANRRAQELLGWDPNPARWVIPEAISPSVDDLVGEVIAGRPLASRAVEWEGRQLSLSGARLPPVYASDEGSVLIAGVDLSEVRRAEQALIQAQRLDAMGQVAGRVAHDFNNLLTLIIGYASMLRRGMEDQRQLEMVANIEAASKRAATLTQQMLDMTRQRIDTGVVIDLGRAVEELDSVLERVAGPQVELTIRRSRNVTKVRLDPSEMEQIVLNLVINACDAMQGKGRVVVSVEVVAPPSAQVNELDLPAGPLALLSITDDGPGMPEAVRARCMEPFFTTKARGKGSGLGLATVYGLVRERGGQMQIDSAPGRGTSIRIWLPLERDAVTTITADEDELWPAGRTVSGRVAVVEDEDGLREMAVDALESVGLQVAAFASAEAALEHFGSVGGTGSFDVLVTDVILPGRSGIELAREVRRTDGDLPVVYMTAYTGPRDNPSGWGDPVVPKPYTPDQLRLRVAESVPLGRIRARSGNPHP